MIRIDDEINIMKVDGETVLEVKVDEKVMELKWVDVWKDWEDLHSSEEMKTLKLKWDTALASTTGGKGTKGKNGK